MRTLNLREELRSANGYASRPGVCPASPAERSETHRVADSTLDGPGAGEDVPADDEAATSGAAGLQAARASIAPAARAANPVGLRFFVTVTGTFLLGLMPGSASSLVSTNR